MGAKDSRTNPFIAGAIILSTAAVALGAGGHASAQAPIRAQMGEPLRGATVTERARPEYDPLGVRAGAFFFYQQLGVEERFDDNIFSADTGEQGDYITSILPSLRVESNWSRHALNLFGTADIARHAADTDEDYEDFTVGGDGRLDITRDNALRASFSYSDLHEDRGSPDDVNGVEPTEFDVLLPRVGYTQRFGRFSAGLDGQLKRFDFDDVRSTAGIINNDDRDRNEWRASARIGYEIIPRYEAFVRGTYDVRRYDTRIDDNGFQRDSDGFEIVAGTAFELTGITFGDVFVGYREQDFDDARFPTIDGVGFGGSLTWNATTLTTAILDFSRTVEETTIVNAAGFFANRVALTVDHELLRNLILTARGSFANKDYRGITRDDDDISAGASARYLLNRNLYLSAEYHFTSRDSNLAGEGFDKNVILIRVETQI